MRPSPSEARATSARSPQDQPREQVFQVAATWGDGFLSVDDTWRIAFVSIPAGRSHAGRAEDVLGQHMRVLVAEDEATPWVEYRRCMQERVPVRFLERLKEHDAWTEVRAYPTSDGGMSVFFRDVSEERRAELQQHEVLRRAQEATSVVCERATEVDSDLCEHKQAQLDEKKRSEFEQQLIGIVSHDLRNPLQAIRLNAAIGLRAAAVDEQARRRFERIIASSDRAARMIDDLLDFTRVRSGGRIPLAPKPVDLHELTSLVVEEVLLTRPERTVERVVEGDGHGSWDADRLAQVVQNLLANALQHTTEETSVRVTTRGEAEHVVLEVQNAGPPIPSDELPHLFEPFRRGRGARRGGGRSLGLGLYISALITDAHGGTIAVESNAHQGTTFFVRLPRVADGASEQGQETTT